MVVFFEREAYETDESVDPDSISIVVLAQGDLSSPFTIPLEATGGTATSKSLCIYMPICTLFTTMNFRYSCNQCCSSSASFAVLKTSFCTNNMHTIMLYCSSTVQFIHHCTYYLLLQSFIFCIMPGDLDYRPLPDNVMFASSVTSMSFPFGPICDQQRNEGLETAILAISVQQADQDHITLGALSSTTVTINGKKQTNKASFL